MEGDNMTQEIEIEFKTVLEKTAFDTLLNALPFSANAIEQTNYYFETNDFALKKQGSAIRIRKKHDEYVITLKQPHEQGILETHERINSDTFMNWIDGKPVATGQLKDQLTALQVHLEDLIYHGYLTTFRHTFTENELEYVLDESHYNGIVDYELELEAVSFTDGEKAFDALLGQYHIQKKAPITKIERFFKSLPSFMTNDNDER